MGVCPNADRHDSLAFTNSDESIVHVAEAVAQPPL